MPGVERRRMRVRTRAGAGLLWLVVLSSTAAACGGGGSDQGGHSGPSSTGASAPTSSATSSTPPTASSTASAPAGPAQMMHSFVVTFPQGWQVEDDDQFSASVADPRSTAQVIMTDDGAISSDTIDNQAQTALGDAKDTTANAQRAANREVDGVEGYVITGSARTTPTLYYFGTVHAGREVQIQITFDRRVPDADQVIEAVLAGVQWNS